MFKYLFSFFKKEEDNMHFWEHIDQLRKYLFRSVIAIFTFSIVAFFYKNFIFNTLILSPSDTKFITYRVLCKLGSLVHIDGLRVQPFHLDLINIELGGQFRYHILISFVTGVIAAFPFIAWQICLFIKPALNEKELKNSRGIIFYITILFLIGVLFGYYVIVPLTVNFLSTYELSGSIKNNITIGSYISTVSVLTLSMGLVFELPMLVYFLTKIRILTAAFLRKSRKYAIVLVFIIAGFITPSTDAFTQTIVAMPLFILYEISIIISKRVGKSLEKI